MFNNYYEDKPVGFTSIPTQKEDLGYVDDTYVYDGKGVTGEGQYEALGVPTYNATSGSYAQNDIITKDGKVYRCTATTSGAWDSAKWTEMSDLSKIAYKV